MKYIIKMMGGDKYEISEETFKSLVGKSGNIFITEIGGVLNFNSLTSMMPKELTAEERIDEFTKNFKLKNNITPDYSLENSKLLLEQK